MSFKNLAWAVGVLLASSTTLMADTGTKSVSATDTARISPVMLNIDATALSTPESPNRISADTSKNLVLMTDGAGLKSSQSPDSLSGTGGGKSGGPRSDACPEGSLFSQTRHLSTEAWSAGATDAHYPILRAESYSVIYEICDIHWWGLEAYHDGSAWSTCTDSDPTFYIKFYPDLAGAPDLGNPACEYTVTATVTPMGESYSGFELKYYSIDLLDPCCSLTDGWVSIQSFGDQECWLMWMSSPEGDASSWMTGGVDAYDLSLCLTNDDIPTTGACCDEVTSICTDLVEEVDCLAQGNRFVLHTLCADMAQPCGEIWGGCCYDDGTCETITQADCALNGGEYRGDGTTCDDCGECPMGSLLSQTRHTPLDAWEGKTSDQGVAYLWAENYSVTEEISDIHWWGFDVFYDENWVECVDSDPTFNIKFYPDLAGEPDLANPAFEYTVTATVTPTGELYNNFFMLNYYSVDLLLPTCTLTDGWVSIQSFGENCWLMWMSSAIGDGLSWGNGAPAGNNMSLCLTNDYVPTSGACCDDASGTCTDSVDQVDCLVQGLRFTADTLCADIAPPCGVPWGGCCFDDGTCTLMAEPDCTSQSGIYQGDDTGCTNPNPCVGACCYEDIPCELVSETICVSGGGIFLGNESTCDQCSECPWDSLFSQTRSLPNEGWNAALSDAVDMGGILLAESYSVTDDICDIHWWGISANADGSTFHECFDYDPTFYIKFYPDAGGAPDLSNPACEYTALATVTPTGDAYAGFQLNHFSIELLLPCCTLRDGWVSIQSFDDFQECSLLWMSSSEGDGTAWTSSTGNILGNDLSVCLTNDYIPNFGACCDDTTPNCVDGVEEIDCLLQGFRYTPDTLCDDIGPPCGVTWGSCCPADGSSCETVTEVDCLAQGGLYSGDDTDCDSHPCMGACCYSGGICDITSEAVCLAGGGDYLGGGSTCDDCGCYVLPPAGAIPEQEPCGERINDGCFTDSTGYESANPGDTVYGTIDWVTGVADRDMYELVLTEPGTVTLTFEAEFVAVFGALYQIVPGLPMDCDEYPQQMLAYGGIVGGCSPAVIEIPSWPAGHYYFYVGPYYPGPACPNTGDYVIGFDFEPAVGVTGACCMPTGDCLELTEECCAGGGGIYHGDGSICGDVECFVVGAEEADLCWDAHQVDVPSFTMGNLAGATPEDYGNCYLDALSGLYFSVIGTGNTMTASTCGDYFGGDTSIGVKCNCSSGSWYCIGYSRDAGCAGAHNLSIFSAEYSWCSEVGHEYIIQVYADWESAFDPGRFKLHVYDDGVPCDSAPGCNTTPGACCLPGSVCQSAIYEAQCDSMGGVWQGPASFCEPDPCLPVVCGNLLCQAAGGENCLTCPEDCGACACVAQPSLHGTSHASDIDCQTCGGGVQLIAENFQLFDEMVVSGVRFFGGYAPGAVLPDDAFTVVVRADDGGLPGAALATFGPVAGTRTDIGGGEYEHYVEMDVTLDPGDYWIEIYNDTTGSDETWNWRTGEFDPSGGLPGVAYSSQMPEAWAFSGAFNMAFDLACEPPPLDIVIWSQPLTMVTPMAYNSMVGDRICADDFEGSDDRPITGVRWWGDYWIGDATPIDGFVIRFFADSGSGTPGTQLYEAFVPGDCDETYYDYSPSTLSYVYAYQTDLPVPFAQVPGEKYWVSIRIDPSWSSPPFWGMHNSLDRWGDAAVQSFGPPYNWSSMTDGEGLPVALAFELRCETPSVLLGDMNCSGGVDMADIDPFVTALTDPDAYAATYDGCNILNGDITGDLSVNGLDIAGFVTLLTGG